MNRKSGIELLRILCMFGIVYMHTFGSMLETVHGGNMALAVFENALFNCGVSCFVLISGYFGIKKNTRRLIKLDLTVIFFSLTATICTTVMGWDAISKTDWIKAIFPVITRRYWFMTCYIVLMLLAPYINPVSYTHLDVYKRQDRHRHICTWRRIMNMKNRTDRFL